MKKSWVLGLSIISSFILVQCHKDNNTPKSRTVLLTQASWKFKSATVNGSDASSLTSACQRDNIYVFAANGSGTANEGASKCNASDPDSVPFTWNFLTSETQLYVSAPLYA